MSRQPRRAGTSGRRGIGTTGCVLPTCGEGASASGRRCAQIQGRVWLPIRAPQGSCQRQAGAQPGFPAVCSKGHGSFASGTLLALARAAACSPVLRGTVAYRPGTGRSRGRPAAGLPHLQLRRAGLVAGPVLPALPAADPPERRGHRLGGRGPVLPRQAQARGPACAGRSRRLPASLPYPRR